MEASEFETQNAKRRRTPSYYRRQQWRRAAFLERKDKLDADAQGRAERAAGAATLHDDGGTGDDDGDPAEAGNVSVKVGIETSCNDVDLESL